jgi:hypothetical protein
VRGKRQPVENPLRARSYTRLETKYATPGAFELESWSAISWTPTISTGRSIPTASLSPAFLSGFDLRCLRACLGTLLASSPLGAYSGRCSVGRQLAELGEGQHRHEKAHYWQANLRYEARASRLDTACSLRATNGGPATQQPRLPLAFSGGDLSRPSPLSRCAWGPALLQLPPPSPLALRPQSARAPCSRPCPQATSWCAGTNRSDAP